MAEETYAKYVLDFVEKLEAVNQDDMFYGDGFEVGEIEKYVEE